MDLKKEIKLSDLLPKRRKRDATDEPKAPKPERNGGPSSSRARSWAAKTCS